MSVPQSAKKAVVIPDDPVSPSPALSPSLADSAPLSVSEIVEVSPSGSNTVLPQLGRILCCMCGVSIVPNAAAMCIPCLSRHSDVAAKLELHGAHEVTQCGKCDKWFAGADHWVPHDLESQGLLNLLLRRVSALQSHEVKVLDAQWIWTEPHSKRLRFSVEVEQAVLDYKMTLRSRARYEVVVRHRQCLDCIRDATEHTWGAMIQLRQGASLTTSGGHAAPERDRDRGKNTQRGGGAKRQRVKALYHVEALLTKHGMHNLMSDVRVARDGFDFFFKAKNQADRVADFLSAHFPLRVKHSKKLVSQDKQNNAGRYEHTIHMELAALQKHDLFLPPKSWTGGRSELFLVHKLSSSLHCVMPCTLQAMDIGANKFFTANPPPCVLLQEKHLTAFVVLDVTPVNAFHAPQSAAVAALHAAQRQQKMRRKQKTTSGAASDQSTLASSAMGESAVGHWLLAEAVVARESDLGENDTTYTVLTHLGHILQAGDSVLGYDLAHAVFGARQEHALQSLGAVPDVVLVQKVFPRSEKAKRKKKKNRAAPWHSKTRPETIDELPNEDELDGERDGEGEEKGEMENVDAVARIEDHADALAGFAAEDELDNEEDEDEEDEDEDEDDGSYEDDLDEEDEGAELALYEGDDEDVEAWEEVA